MSQEPLLVVGTGAMACALGARLARAGVAVTLAGTWRAALETIGAHGITVHEPAVVRAGDAARDSAAADTNWSARVAAVHADALAGVFPLALVLVKSHQTVGAAAALARSLAAAGLAVTLQNGLGSDVALAATLGCDRVATGVAVLGARLLSPGDVRYVPGRVLLGRSETRAPLLARLQEMLLAAGVPTETTSAIDAAVWSKLAANCSINPLSALHGLSNGRLLEDDRLRAELLAAAREVGALAAAKGIRLGRDAGLIALETARATALNRSSMLQDVARGARTEIDALCGAVVREALPLGVPVPVNARLFRLVREREGRPLPAEEMP